MASPQAFSLFRPSMGRFRGPGCKTAPLSTTVIVALSLLLTVYLQLASAREYSDEFDAIQFIAFFGTMVLIFFHAVRHMFVSEKMDPHSFTLLSFLTSNVTQL